MMKQYFSDSEWSTLLQSPTQAILTVILADKADPVSFLKETQAAFQILAAELQRKDISSELVTSIIAALNEEAATEPPQTEASFSKPELDLLRTIQNFDSVSDGQKQAIAHFNQVSTLLVSKVPIAKAEEFRQWIVELSTQVAKAVKEGGMFRIGGGGISRSESDALLSIENALNFKL